MPWTRSTHGGPGTTGCRDWYRRGTRVGAPDRIAALLVVILYCLRTQFMPADYRGRDFLCRQCVAVRGGSDLM